MADWELQVRREIDELEAMKKSPDVAVRQKFHAKDDPACGAVRARGLISTLKDLLHRASAIHPGA
jgi:hypothetical protein